MVSCSTRMKAAGADLLTAAQRAGAVRTDIDIADVLKAVHGMVLVTEHVPTDSDQRERLFSLVIDGMRVPG